MRKELSGTVPERGLSLFVLVSVLVHAVFLVFFSVNYAVGRRPEVWLNYQAGTFRPAAAVKASPMDKIKTEIKEKVPDGTELVLASGIDSGPSVEKIGSGTPAGFRPSQIISTPVLIYPRGAQQAGHIGQVMVVVWLSAEGSPEKADVEKTSGWPELDRAALEQALRWRYRPAFLIDKPVASRLMVPVRFVLPEN